MNIGHGGLVDIAVSGFVCQNSGYCSVNVCLPRQWLLFSQGLSSKTVVIVQSRVVCQDSGCCSFQIQSPIINYFSCLKLYFVYGASTVFF